ncbi:MAG: hypothetical protein ABF283_05205 [Planktotalea arctica]
MYDASFADQDFECDAQEDIKTARMFAFSMIAGIMMWPLLIWGVFF